MAALLYSGAMRTRPGGHNHGPTRDAMRSGTVLPCAWLASPRLPIPRLPIPRLPIPGLPIPAQPTIGHRHG